MGKREYHKINLSGCQVPTLWSMAVVVTCFLLYKKERGRGRSRKHRERVEIDGVSPRSTFPHRMLLRRLEACDLC